MKFRSSCRLAAIALAVVLIAGPAFAQDEIAGPVPRFVTLPPKPSVGTIEPLVTLPTWTGSFTYLGTKYSFYMVGTAPSTGTSTTVNAFIIPVKVVIGTHTFDPKTTNQGGKTVVQRTQGSPIFQTQTYTLGGTNIGDTQYEDAFQRANFWGSVKSHSGYHILLGGPTVLPELSLTPGSNGAVLSSNPSGGSVRTALVNINWFDPAISAYISSHSQITPNTIPIFMTVNTYLTNGAPTLSNCCIGGYHSANGPQAYSHFTYIPIVGDFAQDVSALSHEIGEWMDDPGVKGAFNPVGCVSNPILEVGDPEEGFANFGAFPYSLGGFTYNLQDLVFVKYFGTPGISSVHSWMTFHNNPFGLTACSHGG